MQITDLHYLGGHEVLHVLGKGNKPAEIPLPITVLRAVTAATAGRTSRPVLQSRKGLALTGAQPAAGLHGSPTPPASLIPSALTPSGGPSARPDARTTIRYDMAHANLDRHAAHSVAAYLAGMAIG